jgi:hypothetical protein
MSLAGRQVIIPVSGAAYRARHWPLDRKSSALRRLIDVGYTNGNM